MSAMDAETETSRWLPIEPSREPSGPVLLRGPRFSNPVVGLYVDYAGGWILVNEEGRSPLKGSEIPVHGATEYAVL